jgi:hypothetical protein
MEAGLVAMSCGRPERVDDLHFTSDLHGLIQPGSLGPERGLPATALLLTSLRPTAPFILLNTSMGDQAELARRHCGCALESLGWPAHLHTIRSFEKLTAGGMTFLDTELIRALETLLPARFGGGPTDYQLVEEEYSGREARLCLRVHPAVGPLDEREVLDTFLALIGSQSGAKRIVELQWRQGGLLRLERQPPLATASGKIHHLHLDRQQERRRS